MKMIILAKKILQQTEWLLLILHPYVDSLLSRPCM